MEFKEYKLKDIIECFDYKRKPLSTIKRANFKGKYPYYGAQEIIDYVSGYLFDGKFVLLAEDGENLRSKVKPIANIVTGKFWLNNHAHIFKTKPGFNIDYIYYYLNSIDISGYITGTTQPKLNQTNMNNIEIIMPEMEYQNKIAKILSILDKKIELNNQINDNLLELANCLIDDNYSNSDGFDTLSSIIKFVKGKKPKHIDNIKHNDYEKYLTIACLNNQELNYADNEKMILSDNNILMVMDGASSGDVYFNDYGIVGSTLARVDLIDKKYLDSYIYFILRKHQGLIKSKNTGSAIPHTDKVFVGTLEVPIIEKEEQEKYKKLVDKLLEIRQENQTLTQLRDTLLPKLMNGEIDLEKIEI